MVRHAHQAKKQNPVHPKILLFFAFLALNCRSLCALCAFVVIFFLMFKECWLNILNSTIYYVLQQGDL